MARTRSKRRDAKRWPLAAASCVLWLGAGAARAEDFTGFYAGVNAGYARGVDRPSGTVPPSRLPSSAETALPPSAARAAGANPAMSARPSRRSCPGQAC
ncbi:hypothetical protein [Methylobacterium oryzisoli]|uniref:hypothetical protein n=1 Tax=Methylobacterium oryzisoli TaxID=3385502 RepID=UPI0038921828